MARQSEVEIGHVWSAKISGRLVHVRVDKVHKPDNWSGPYSHNTRYKTKYSLTNLKTGRKVGPYAATKLRMRHRHLETANSSNL